MREMICHWPFEQTGCCTEDNAKTAKINLTKFKQMKFHFPQVYVATTLFTTDCDNRQLTYSATTVLPADV